MSIIDVRLTEPQLLMYLNRNRFTAFIAGYGTGKTNVLAECAILDAMEGGRQSKILIGEPTYQIISEVIWPLIEEKLTERGIKYSTNVQQKSITPAAREGLGSFWFRSYEKPEKIVASHYFRAHLDELDVMPAEKAEQVWRKVLGRMRQNPSTYKKITDRCPRSVSVYTTPEGFRFAYSKWGDENIEREKGYDLIRASTYSNPFLDDDYIPTLIDAYPPNLIKAYLMGEFVNLNSGAVYPDFDRMLNKTNWTWRDLDDDHDFLVGMDFNVYNCTATVCINHKDGHLYAVDEFTGVRDTETMCRAIKERYGSNIVNRCWIYPDSSGKNHHSVGADRSDIDILYAHGFKVYVESTNPLVSERVAHVNALILNGAGHRRFLINSNTCPQLTKSLEQQAYDKHGKPDKSTGFDHSAETVGYIIARTHPIYIRTETQHRQRSGILLSA